VASTRAAAAAAAAAAVVSAAAAAVVSADALCDVGEQLLLLPLSPYLSLSYLMTSRALVCVVYLLKVRFTRTFTYTHTHTHLTHTNNSTHAARACVYVDSV